jgi:hypothetical protein
MNEAYLETSQCQVNQQFEVADVRLKVIIFVTTSVTTCY